MPDPQKTLDDSRAAVEGVVAQWAREVEAGTLSQADFDRMREAIEGHGPAFQDRYDAVVADAVKLAEDAGQDLRAATDNPYASTQDVKDALTETLPSFQIDVNEVLVEGMLDLRAEEISAIKDALEVRAEAPGADLEIIDAQAAQLEAAELEVQAEREAAPGAYDAIRAEVHEALNPDADIIEADPPMDMGDAETDEA